MKEYELRSILYGYLEDICHISKLQVLVTAEHQQKYYQQKIDEKINACINTLLQRVEQNAPADSFEIKEIKPDQTRQFTLEELEYYDGSEGKPAYVAVEGNVYDMSNIIQWAGGTHFGLFAGRNLTEELRSCHIVPADILSKLTKVGTLIL